MNSLFIFSYSSKSSTFTKTRYSLYGLTQPFARQVLISIVSITGQYFANNIKMAEKIPNAIVYSSRTSKKRSATAIEDFNSGKITLLSTVKKADEGLDVKGLSVAIIFGLDSSTTRACQRRGRSIRFEQGKTAEIFNIVLNRTQETKWFYDSHKGDSFITIDESELDKVLQGKDFTPGEKIVPKFDFRF